MVNVCVHELQHAARVKWSKRADLSCWVKKFRIFLIQMRPKTEVHDWYEWIKPILTYEPNDLLLRPLWHDYKRFIIITEMVKVTWPAALHQLFYFDIFERYRWGEWVIRWRRSNSRTNTVNVYFNMTAAFQLKLCLNGNSTRSSLNGDIMTAVDGLYPDSKRMHLQLRCMIILSID